MMQRVRGKSSGGAELELQKREYVAPGGSGTASITRAGTDFGEAPVRTWFADTADLPSSPPTRKPAHPRTDRQLLVPRHPVPGGVAREKSLYAPDKAISSKRTGIVSGTAIQTISRAARAITVRV